MRSTLFERAFGEAAASGHEPAAIVLDMSRNYTDFVYFLSEMVAIGEKVEQMTARCMIEARRDMGDDDAPDVATLLELQEQQLLDSETKAKCAEYEQLLKVNPRAVARTRSPSASGGFGPLIRGVPLKQ
jgi:hypothetical protein